MDIMNFRVGCTLRHWMKRSFPTHSSASSSATMMATSSSLSSPSSSTSTSSSSSSSSSQSSSQSSSSSSSSSSAPLPLTSSLSSSTKPAANRANWNKIMSSTSSSSSSFSSLSIPSSLSPSSSSSVWSVLLLLNSASIVVCVLLSVLTCAVAASADVIPINSVPRHSGAPTRNSGSLHSIHNNVKFDNRKLDGANPNSPSSPLPSSLLYSSEKYSNMPSYSSHPRSSSISSSISLSAKSSSSSSSSSSSWQASVSFLSSLSSSSSKSVLPSLSSSKISKSPSSSASSSSSSTSSSSSSISRAPTPPPPPPTPPHFHSFSRHPSKISTKLIKIDNNEANEKEESPNIAIAFNSFDFAKPPSHNTKAANTGSSPPDSNALHQPPPPPAIHPAAAARASATATETPDVHLPDQFSQGVIHFIQQQDSLVQRFGTRSLNDEEKAEFPKKFRQSAAAFEKFGYSLKNQPHAAQPNFQQPLQRVHRSRRSAKQTSYSQSSPDGSLPRNKETLDDREVSKVLNLVKETSGLKNDKCVERTVENMDRIITPEYLSREFSLEVNLTVQVANFINALYLHGNAVDWLNLYFLYPLTQSVAEFSPKVKGCGVAFENPQDPKSDYFPYPYSYRCGAGSLVVSDLSTVYSPEGAIWFKYHRDQEAKDTVKVKDVYYTMDVENCNVTAFNKHWNRSVTVTPANGFWYMPYFDCQLKIWLVQYSSPFYTLNKKGQPEFKGVVLLDVNLEAVPINQCAKDGKPFADSHRCHRESTECENIPTQRLTVGSYRCVCKPGYTFPHSSTSFGIHGSSSSSSSSSSFSHSPNDHFRGTDVEDIYLEYINNVSKNYETNFRCIPSITNMSALSQTAPAGSLDTDQGESIVAFNFLVRGIPLGIQSFCMTVAVVIGMVIVCLRKTKVMHSSIWILLEMLILGAIFLYATVVIQYFEPTNTTCLLQPWFREIGFSIVYGVLVLKVYRILAEFQSRKAHRVHIRDKDLLKYLFIMLVVVIAYMLAWTAVNIDHLDHNSTILEHLETSDDGREYVLCRAMWWDYVIEAGELIFLCCGIYMCYCVRSAPTEYREGKFLTGAIVYEAVMSTIFYLLRHLWWYQLHPDYLFLMFFLRCQLTVTVVLLVIIGPKLWYAHHPPDDDHARTRAYSQSDVQDSSSPEMMKLNVGISSNGDVEVGEISLTEMDPEDIRAELKRLYTQLQIYKTKAMRKDNPHISKRRGGRKQTHRRFSLQAFHHKHRHHHDHDHDHEMSKTPEESTNSAEAMTFTMEPSVKEEPGEGRSMPSVSFKGGHK